jgi:hypothetical protein
MRLVFSGAGDKKVTLSYLHADGTTPDAAVKAVMEDIIANNDIFVEPPLGIVGAEFITRTVVEADVS